ncbi:MAG: secretion system protein, partial [Pseudomonadota bacterium]|nr:secretion system protein [Pseudomonadota bacterium]
IGALFRSARWRRNETELVIIVTPQVVRAARDPLALPNPLQPSAEADAAAIVLQGRVHDRPITRPVGTEPTR